MNIEVDRLGESDEGFAQEYGRDNLALGDDRADLLRAQINGYASRKGESVRVQGTLSADVEVVCDRCLQPVPVSLKGQFDIPFVPLDRESEQVDSELKAEDLETSFYEGNVIDVDQIAREQVLLGLPIRTLCREECKGLCAGCGIDLNTGECSCSAGETDPRWDALASLR